MPNTKKLSGINLVPQDEFDRSVIGKALKWALTTGKSIVILTEFVVIMAFLSRFKLDRDLNDLNELIIQKQSLVEAYSEVEQDMLDIQARMNLVGQIETTSVSVTQSMEELALLVPLDTRLETVELGQLGWLLRGVAGSEIGFATFMSRLENSGKFGEIGVGDIRFDLRKGGLVFALDARFPKTPPVSRPTTTTSTRQPTPTTEEEASE